MDGWDRPDSTLLRSLRDQLAQGQLIVVPTDTVYGLAADPFVEGATLRIFEAKRRPPGLSLPILCASADQARSLAKQWGQLAEALAARFWPGPLTLVVERSSALAEVELGGDRSTVGLRVPDHEFLRALLEEGPLAVTSANIHRDAPASLAGEAAASLGGDVSVIVDGGICDGIVSSVVDVREGLIVLREGAIDKPALEAALGAI
jgi:L-threonylcarbamoyladenylate synthase